MFPGCDLVPSAVYWWSVMGGRGGRSKSVVEVVESIYAGLASGDARQWLGRVLGEMQGCVSDCVGGFAYAYDIAGDPASWRIAFPVVHGAPGAMAEHIYRAFEATPPEGRVRVLPRLGPTGTFSVVTGQTLSIFGPHQAARFNAQDAVHVNALDASEQGVLVALTIPRPRRLSAAEARRLRMLSAHIASAMRLMQGALSREPAVVFEHNGKVAHAGPGHETSLTTLRSAVLGLARARSGRAEPDDVLEAWQALVAGRYSLIDRFSFGGRRYVVAFENAPDVRDPRGLSTTEAAVASWARHGHSQKHIAYELGLSVGTVSGLLHRVFQKLGVRSRPELVERLSIPSAASRVSVGSSRLFVFESAPQADGLAGLTPAEQEVARSAALGKPTSLIARERRVSERTVTNQLASVFRKLGARSRSELAARLSPR